MTTVQPNGLTLRWCSGRVGSGCAHWVTTHEPILEEETARCPFDGGVHWKEFMRSWTQDQVVALLRHALHCQICLQDSNSYVFRAWYALSRDEVERAISLYVANWPTGLMQPLLHVAFDQSLYFRIFTPDLRHGLTDGLWDLRTHTCRFTLVLDMPDGRDHIDSWVYQDYEFDLSQSSGWADVLRTFPQEPRMAPAALSS